MISMGCGESCEVGGWSGQAGRIDKRGQDILVVYRAVTGPEEGFMAWVWLWHPLSSLSIWMMFLQAWLN
jgi:hypothetical protein